MLPTSCIAIRRTFLFAIAACLTTSALAAEPVQPKFVLEWGKKGDGPGRFGTYMFGNLPHTFGPIGIVIDRYD